MNLFCTVEEPPSPPFRTFFPNFMTKICSFETKKICNVMFWIKNDPPPPPLRTFFKKTSKSESMVTPLILQWIYSFYRYLKSSKGSNKSSCILWQDFFTKMKSLENVNSPSRDKVWKMHACARTGGPLRFPEEVDGSVFPFCWNLAIVEICGSGLAWTWD